MSKIKKFFNYFFLFLVIIFFVFYGPIISALPWLDDILGYIYKFFYSILNFLDLNAGMLLITGFCLYAITLSILFSLKKEPASPNHNPTS